VPAQLLRPMSMPNCPASRHGRRAVWGAMMRRAPLLIGVLAGLLLGGCRISTSRAPGRKEAMRTNAISNKHILTEQPTLERATPHVAPAADTVH
jgi:hypothetical protein